MKPIKNYNRNYEKEMEVRLQFKEDFPFFSRNCLKIRPKEPVKDSDGNVSGGLVPFTLNPAQIILNDSFESQLKSFGFVRHIILKGRQQGCSTLVGGRFLWKSIHIKGVRVFILTHRKDATDNLFDMTQRYYLNLPDQVRPFVDRKNAKELSFLKLDSGYKVGTAGADDVGRSQTINYLHGSEVALWKNAEDISSGVLQAVPRNSEIILESTAKGTGNFFHTQWLMAESGKSDYVAKFIPWFLQPEYRTPLNERFKLEEEDVFVRDLYKLTNEQMFWRQQKISELGLELFKQEYPCCSTEAFTATIEKGMIPINLVEEARKCNADAYGPILMGVDPARSENGDRTSIIMRQGRVAHSLSSFKTDDTMKVVGIIVDKLNNMNIAGVFIDVVGIGAGIVDRLREMGYQDRIFAVNAGAKPMDSNKFSNKKAEMWGLMKEWFSDKPCKIPDVDTLVTDLCAPKCDWNSNSALIIESKKSLKERFGSNYSPDEAEALALTFAYPINNYNSQVNFKRVFRL